MIEAEDLTWLQQSMHWILLSEKQSVSMQVSSYGKRSRWSQGTDEVVLTDEKWLSFIVEQILSNAVKYTQQGSVTIRVEGDRQLVIEDTGIGIAAEDIPRIFEKGYTGENGRLGKKSTGIGLYLSQMAAKKLGHTISVESIPGEGSSFKIDLSSYALQVE